MMPCGARRCVSREDDESKLRASGVDCSREEKPRPSRGPARPALPLACLALFALAALCAALARRHAACAVPSRAAEEAALGALVEQARANGVLLAGVTTADAPPPAERAAAPAAAPAASGERRPWLRLAIMSHGRTGDADYLLRVLFTIFEDMPPHQDDPIRSAVDVLVVNNQQPPSEHKVFAQAAHMFAGRASFVNKVPRDCPVRSGGRRKSASHRVQRQSCDIVAAMDAMLQHTPRAHHVMFLEDDWLLCPHGLNAALHAMRKAYRYDPQWLALRVSYGFNGIVVREADMPSLRDHIAANYALRPPDHLVFEWFSGEKEETKAYATGRSFRIFRYNVFHHIGHISTLQQPTNRFTPGCYSLLYDWLIPDVETFNEKECPDDDIWPCKEAAQHVPSFFGRTRLSFSAPSFQGVERKVDRATRPMSELPPLGSIEAPPRRLRAEGDATAPRFAVEPRGEGTWRVHGDAVRQGESCAAACKRLAGTSCDATGLRAINNCAALQQHMLCPMCQSSSGVDQPARVVDDAPSESLPGVCLYTVDDVDCNGSHPLTKRMCACARP